MAPSTVYTRASSSLTSSSNPAVLRSLTSSSIKRSRHVPSRSLWWGRQGTWSTSHEDNIEERLQRHQKIMRHRYSRALRRKAMWDREDAGSSWLWRVPDARLGRRWGACRTMSSTDPKAARLDEKHDNSPGHRELWGSTRKELDDFNADFEAFKAEIDRAIEKDPYGTVFGRRLHSPPTENNSSWISWLFNMGAEPTPSVTEVPKSSGKRKIEIEVLDKKGPPKQSQPPQPAESVPNPSVTHVQSTPATEYMYDPISGRKVLRSSSPIEPPSASKQGFLESLFSEHGAMQDKPAKQHRVFGHNPKLKQTTRASDVETAELKTGFESSRLREYQRLRAATLGNHIDTTASYAGKFEADPVLDDEQSEKKVRNVPEPEANAPLFSGTTYESKAQAITQDKETEHSPWLEKEGFRASELHTGGSEQDKSTDAQRLQPAFERMQPAPGSDRQQLISRLEPAVDRALLAKVKANVPSVTSKSAASKLEKIVPTPMLTGSETDMREDVDLLRASDVRAAARAARVTKQEMAQAKFEQRGQLEAKFDSLQKQPQSIVPDAKQLRADSGKLSRSIDNTRQHAERFPDGVVAKTMKSIGMINEKFKDYQKPYQPGRMDLTQRLDFSNKALEKLPSIYKAVTAKPQSKNAVVALDTSTEVEARQNLTESLRLFNRKAAEIKQRDDAQIEELADGIRQIFESEHGPIDLALAQNSSKANKIEDSSSTRAGTKTSEMQTHFSVEQARFLSEVNKLGKDVSSIKTKALQLEKRKDNKSVAPSEYVNELETLSTEAESCNRRADVLSDAYDRSGRLQGPRPHPLSFATIKQGVPRYPAIERHTTVFEPKYIQLLSELKSIKIALHEVSTNLHDHKRSRVAPNARKTVVTSIPGSEKQARTERVKPTSAMLPGESPYLILVYNKTTGEVDKNALERLPWSPAGKVEKANPIKIMGNLNYPAAFVTHFVELEKTGYELSSGGGDMLIFQKKSLQVQDSSQPKVSKSETQAPKGLRNVIAAEEASSQPEISETIAQPKSQTPREAATVLDEIPIEISPPGPAAPTAPSTERVKKTLRTGPKVRRQEQVFSGTIPLRSIPKESQAKDDSSSSKREQDNSNERPDGPSFYARTSRAVKRGVFGAAAFGAAAYTIGVVAEGIGAQAQVEGDAVTGPRTKVVMPVGQRPGIYSTESSR